MHCLPQEGNTYLIFNCSLEVLMKNDIKYPTTVLNKWTRVLGAVLTLVLMASTIAYSAATTPDPLLPTNANANQGLTPTLSWSAATGLGTITYHLQVATKADFSVGLVDYTPLSSTSHQLATLSSNTTYYWHVVAMDDGVEGTYSTTWSFETGEMPLGTAADFGILAAGAILGGPTTVTGNIGTNAGGVSLITPEAGYLIYDYSVPGDKSIVDAGQADLAAAYADFYVRPGSVAIAADLGGQTLTPGVYNIVGNAAMSSDMTFNGHGVYIIQLGSFITTTGGVTVNLSGGALWTDIFWVVNDYVSLGAGTAFQGTVMATNYISIGASGASQMEGRLLSKGAAVTVGSPTVLPVELVSFTAKANGMQANLRWSTATETNNYGFDVERRQTRNWEKIGFVPGAGTSSSPRYYSYTDNNLSYGSYGYRIKQINKDGSFSYRGSAEVEIVSTPQAYALIQNYPNPFNPSTRIQYSLEKAGPVSLKVYNVLGLEVATLVNGPQEAGSYTVPFNAQGLASGVYFYRLQTGSFVSTKKLILMK
jgi:hypothetical protein